MLQKHEKKTFKNCIGGIYVKKKTIVIEIMQHCGISDDVVITFHKARWIFIFPVNFLFLPLLYIP